MNLVDSCGWLEYFADSIVLATAQLHKAIVWTQDSDFKDIPGVKGSGKNNFTFSHLIFRPSLSALQSLNPQRSSGYACGSAHSDRPNLT